PGNLDERQAFLDELRPLRRVPASVAPMLPDIAMSSQSIMDGVRSSLSVIGAAAGFKPTLDISAEERRANSLQICAGVPTLIMSLYRLRQGRSPIEPRDDL